MSLQTQHVHMHAQYCTPCVLCYYTVPWIIRSAVGWMISGPLKAIHVMVMLLCSDGAVKFNVNWLPPLGRSVWIATLPTTVGVEVIASVTPLSTVAQVNSTSVPALTFLDSGTVDSVMTDWVPVKYARYDFMSHQEHNQHWMRTSYRCWLTSN